MAKRILPRVLRPLSLGLLCFALSGAGAAAAEPQPLPPRSELPEFCPLPAHSPLASAAGFGAASLFILALGQRRQRARAGH